MNIVVLDGYCLNPGDLQWNTIVNLGNLTIYDRTQPDQIIERALNANAILTNKTKIDETVLSKLPNLKYIGVLATGYNVVDIAAATKRNICVTNIPAYSTYSVAQMAFAHILNITNQVELHSQSVRNNRWTNCKDFSYCETQQIELLDKTIGLVGLGNTGMATANIALSFGLKVIAFTSKTTLPDNIASVPLETLWQQSDIISLHCPLCDNTQHIICEKSISQMKHSAIIINTGRGPLIDEQALANALNNNRIAAAGIDVLSTEPPMANNPLLTAKNCHITPHIAWATFEARTRLMNIAAQNLMAFINNKPINKIN